MINTIRPEVKLFQQQIIQLKRLAPEYPGIYKIIKGNVFWATTMVSFIFDGKKYKRHHVESCLIIDGTEKRKTLLRLQDSCELTQVFGQPCQFDEEIIEN